MAFSDLFKSTIPVTTHVVTEKYIVQQGSTAWDYFKLASANGYILEVTEYVWVKTKIGDNVEGQWKFAK